MITILAIHMWISPPSPCHVDNSSLPSEFPTRQAAAAALLPGPTLACPGDYPKNGVHHIMIISHKHRFIFVHCRKVAGSSLKVFLSRFLGPTDLQLGAWHDALEQSVWPNRRVWQDLLHHKAGFYLARTCLRHPSKLLTPYRFVQAVNGTQKMKYVQSLGQNPPHPSATALRDFDPFAWDNYFKFCFVRNPYERAVSDYFWRCRVTGRTDQSFLEFLHFLDAVQEGQTHASFPFDNWPMYTINDEVAVDFVGRFENLREDLHKVCNKLALPFDRADLPTAKKSHSSYHYRDWYGPKERHLVEKLFYNELEYFQYGF